MKKAYEIKGNNISVIVKSKEHSNKIANDIMRTLQSNFEDYKYYVYVLISL